MYYSFVKKILDYLSACLLLIILSPIFILVALLLTINNKGNPFFIQKRPGLHGRIFNIIKFKTMSNIYNEEGELLPDQDRLTRVGRLIRYTSLDEIPQLINVLMGEMSLVGPRPLLPEYLPLYNDFQMQRHIVKPGITGYAQVNGRNAISWEKKFEMDIYYVENISFTLDIKILFKTILSVFKGSDVNNTNTGMTNRFKGNKIE